MTPVASNLKIDSTRLWGTIHETAKFGATPKGGVRRLTLGPEDKQVRDWFRNACEAAGLEVHVDTLGSMFGLRKGRDMTKPPVGLGSHLDTQPTGGKFDGNYGVLAGLTVYAVPQVLAAAAPAGAVAVHIGTYVKLVRVLMLGPVVLVLSLLARRAAGGDAPRAGIGQLVPWFIVGFVAMLLARSFGWIPQPLLRPFAQASSWLTVVSMAALGLGVDVRSVARAGPRVTAVVTLSLLALGVLSWGLLQLLPIGAR
ncbi:putative hydrolase [mine drainage metagenome]|uniref:Putative hydrolase n=1 Tax=mine drainage metagenome TaxID=410659 RepID=A0A1J5Q0X5_9ZZZZ